MNDRELATVLAALRFWQEHPADSDACVGEEHSAAIEEIVDSGGVPRLNARQVDELCERLNTGDSAPTIVVTFRDGIAEEVEAREPTTILTIDHDTDGAEDDDLHTLPNGDRVLTSLTAATVSDLSDYQPLLAHLPGRHGTPDEENQPTAAEPATPGE